MAAEAHNPSCGTDRVAKLRVEYAMARSSQYVIPAKAGIQGWRGDATAGVPPSPCLDSRFRGNDVCVDDGTVT